MTTQSQVSRWILKREDRMILGIGAAVGVLATLPMLGLLLDNRLRGDASLLKHLPPLLGQWLTWASQVLVQQTTLMGWPLAAETSAYWYMSRGAGLVGYLLLWGATAWGLVVSTKVGKGWIAAPFATGLHEFLSLSALAFAGFHALALLGDHYIDFGLIDVVYPFAASYRPGWVGLGQVGLYLSAALAFSFTFASTSVTKRGDRCTISPSLPTPWCWFTASPPARIPKHCPYWPCIWEPL
jgi:hypothetical protein